ncbi:MAG TPA: tetratricopeptide repeat protein, partial [Fimbriimonadaceae bacterium]|nr:tetratricopeptide repeat protein [Fimbriimonadaceae bacterium]
VLVAVLVVTAGAIVATLNTRSAVAANVKSDIESALPRGAAFEAGPQTPNTVVQQNTSGETTQQNRSQIGPGDEPPIRNGQSANTGALPRPGSSNSFGGRSELSGSIPPVSPPTNFQLVPSGNQTNTLPSPTPGGGNAKPQVEDGRDPSPTTVPVKDEEPKDQGVYEIQIGRGSANKPAIGGGGSEDVEDQGNQLEALLATAKSQFLAQRYESAAKSYDRALAAGAEPASTYQRLGQCYEKLGRNSEALYAYDRAISACESAMGSGRGSARIQSILNSSKRAAKLLRGG